MFRKILIANRGEIALRIIQACRELGIKTVAVYSEADSHCLHAQLADEAICIGGSQSSDSYLKSDRILSAAEIADVDAIHPGYGFLSENETFADQCKECNITFIGPRPDSIKKMGDKAMAREVARKAKAPTVPGSEGAISNEKEALKIAQKLGFPVIIKASAGGGGKGMRLAHNAASFSKEYNTAQAEAQKAFGDSSVYIEKYIEEPRHIEFQILGDKNGHIIHLGERDCSVQRRFQKLIEEGPSPFLTSSLREKMGKAAIKIAESCQYENAGTMEFLVDKHGDFYFIEMNTRIQVEHGVTEQITNVDLVKWQIRIAMGEKLTLSQKDIRIQGHAIECRICAEDPSRGFTPGAGTINLYCAPGGPGVRVDSHLYGGYAIPPYYDSMISKLITYGDDRKLAISRMYRALSQYIIRGIPTTIPFCKAVMQDPLFQSGQVTTRYIEDFMNRTPKDLFNH